MGKLSDWVKANAKDGVDFTAIEKLIDELSIDGITSKEQAHDFIKKHSLFNSAFDSAVTAGVDTYKTTFETEKLPSLIEAEKDKIKLELNPPKTEAEKQLVEMQKTIDALNIKDKQSSLESVLVGKAKELGIPAEIAKSYSAFGENAEAIMKSHGEMINLQVKSGLETAIKEKFGDIKPPVQTKSDPDKMLARADFEQLGAQQRMDFATSGGVVTE